MTKHEQAKQERQRSGAVGPHADRRTRRVRTRGEAQRRAVRDEDSS